MVYPSIDLTGLKYKDWTVIRRIKHKGTCAWWIVKCKCGVEKKFTSHYIRNVWKSQDCGCSTSLVMKKFGMLTPIEKIGNKYNSYAFYRCICDCGNERTYPGAYLWSGQRKSCGCARTKCVEDIGPPTVLNHYKQASKLRKIEFSIDKKEFYKLISKNCFYCNSVPSSQYKMNKVSTIPQRIFLYNGVDRVDNSKGYIEGNCVTCCKRCNQMKNDMPTEEWFSHMRKILSNNPQKDII